MSAKSASKQSLALKLRIEQRVSTYSLAHTCLEDFKLRLAHILLYFEIFRIHTSAVSCCLRTGKSQEAQPSLSLASARAGGSDSFSPPLNSLHLL